MQRAAAKSPQGGSREEVQGMEDFEVDGTTQRRIARCHVTDPGHE